MMYAFENKEPDMDLYNFKLTTAPYEDALTKSYEPEYGRAFKIECDNEEEKARYYADLDAHEKRVQEGLNLFGAKFKSLWW